MFERKLSSLGKKTKQIIREFTGKTRLSDDQYYAAMDKYNEEVDKQKKEAKKIKKELSVLPVFIEQNQAELKISRKTYQEERRQKKEKKVNVILDFKHGKVINSGFMDLENIRYTYQTEILFPLMELCKKLAGFYKLGLDNGNLVTKGKIVYIQSSIDGNIFKYGLVEITSNNYETIFWDYINQYIETYIDGELYNIFEQCNSYARIVIFDSDKEPPKQITQKFLDGKKHCVIEPIRRMYQEYANNSTTKDSKRKFTSVIKKLDILEQEYKDGVPEEDMEIIGKAISRCIIIHDLIGKETKKYNTKSSKYIHFTNTRKNHLDYGFLTCSGKYTLVKKNELFDIMMQHDKDGIFYIMDGYIDKENNCKEAKVLSSPRGNWRVVNDDYEIYNEFDKQIGKKNYGLNAVEYHDLNEFIKEGRIINATPVPLCQEPNNIEYAHHIDISKAYTQHRLSKYYGGFLGHIHGYSKLNITSTQKSLEFLQSHIGMYQFKVIQFPSSTPTFGNPTFKKSKKQNGVIGAEPLTSIKDIHILKKFGIFENYIYTLPSVEIISFILEYGLKIHLIAGCWGSRFDFDYTPELLENKRYAIWAGKLGQDTPTTKYTFKGDAEWAYHLKHELGSENVFYFKDMDIITIILPNKGYNTYHHIFAFITAYTRMNMLSVINKIDGDLIKVIMDGIYFRGEIQDTNIPYKYKEKIQHVGFREYWYYPSIIDTSKWANYNPDFDGNCILAGAGGTGKTYSVYNYKGLIKPLYVVPSHILGQKGKEAYNCSYTTINRLIGDGCIPYKEMYREPHTILIDELTMTNKPYIEKAIEMYPTSLILLAGDIDKKQWFQCRNGTPQKWNEIFMPTDWKYVYYTNDMRSKDNEIKQIKINIRNKMKEIFEIGGVHEAMIINEYIKNNYNVISYIDAIKQFQPGDIWISGTHAVNKKLLENGIVSGYIDKNKVINQNGDGEKRGSFTIHSYQGLTIEKEKVFISLDTFEYSMLYTAVSRCRHFNQIVFVN